MPSAPVHPLASFLPQIISLGGDRDRPPEHSPHRESLFCTVLFADLSGFTARTDALSHQPNGPEAIGQLLNAHLKPLVRSVEAFGGDIVKFAGDALLACWPNPDDGADVRSTVLSAAACGLAMQHEIRELAQTLGDDVLQLKVGLATGPIRVLHLGDSDVRRVLLVSGDGVDRATRGADLAAPGEVRIGRLAQQLVGEEVQVVWDGEMSVVVDVTPIDHFLPPEPPRRQWHQDFRAYLPATIRDKDDLGSRGWLTETRIISVVFVHLPNLTFGADPERMHQVFLTAHQAVHKLGGVTNKMSIDEKGVTLLAVFGLPPRVHEDDAARACRAGMAIQRALQRAGEAVSVGIATGRAFCGEVGGADRREYTVIGNAVNTAARLMVAGPGRVSTDRETAERAQHTTRFEALSPVRLKGKPRPTERYQPVGRIRRAPSSADNTRPIGRNDQLDRITRVAGRAAQTRASAFELLVGPAGIGKSAIAHAASLELERAGMRVLRTHADGVASGRLGTPLRALLQALFGSGSTATEAHRVRSALREAVGADAPLLGLVDDLLPVSVGATPGAPAANDRRTRADLLARLLLHGIAATPTAIIIEDVHWIDPLTLAVLHTLAGAEAPLFWLLTARPPPDASPKVWTALRALASPRVLEPLGRPQTRQLIARRLGVRNSPDALASLVFARSAGNPLFIIHLADHLRATGAVEVRGRRIQVQADHVLQWQAGLPVTLEGLLLSRVDRLGPHAQFTLKVASIFGERFHEEGLVQAHPLERAHDAIQADLKELQQQEIIAATSTPGQWRFRHILIRDAIYEILPYNQRQGLHRAAVRYLAASRPIPWFDLGAHARRAGDDEQALDAFTRAAARAARHGVPADCARTLEAASDLFRTMSATPIQAARLAMAQAIVLEDLGDLGEARTRITNAIAVLETSSAPDSEVRKEQSLAHLLSGRLHIRSCQCDAAAEHARLARATSPGSEDVVRSALLLEATAVWRSKGARAAVRLLLDQTTEASWELQLLQTVFELSTARVDNTIHQRIRDFTALLDRPEARRTSADDRTRFFGASVGFLLLSGEPADALALLQRHEAALSSRGARALVQLTAQLADAPLPPDPSGGARTSGCTDRFTHDMTHSLRTWRDGHLDRVPAQLAIALAHTEGTATIPGPDSWPAVLAATLLAEACAHNVDDEVFERLDLVLSAAGRCTPSARPAFTHLRARLARARGQTTRAWWLTRWPNKSPETLGWFGANLTLPPPGRPRAVSPGLHGDDTQTVEAPAAHIQPNATDRRTA